MKIKVIDAICGAGKTSYAIQYMNEHSKAGFGSNEDFYMSEEKFIYVTPFLSEVTRVINNTRAEFAQPVNKNESKYKHVKKLIEEGKSIVMTHELFSRLDEEILSDIEFGKYTLIMDEVANVIQQIPTYSKDIEYLIKAKAITVNKNNEVVWLDEDYELVDESRYRDIKVLSEKGNLFIEKGNIIFWTMPVKSFLCFEEVYILTYLFNSQTQKYYYDLYDIEFEKFSVIRREDGRYELTEHNVLLENRKDIYELLNVYEDYIPETGRASKLNSNFDSSKKKQRYHLSGTWLKNAAEGDLNQLNKNLISYFRTQNPTHNKKIFWTTLTEVAPKLKNAKCKLNKNKDRSKDNFVPLNIRATNDYADCEAMAYIYNRFMNPIEKNFFSSRGIVVNEDQLAVSDLIQFLFRGCIRNGNVMNCYIPSIRMRNLLEDWSDNKI